MVNFFLDQSHHGNLDQSQQVDLEQSIRYRVKYWITKKYWNFQVLDQKVPINKVLFLP